MAKGLALLTPLPPTVDFKKEEVLPVLLALLEKGLPKGPEEPDPMVEENTFFTPVPWVLLVAGFENGFAAEVSFGAPARHHMSHDTQHKHTLAFRTGAA